MRTHHRLSVWVGRGMLLALGVALADGVIVLSREDGGAAAQQQQKIEATIFSYDGRDFVRTKTTLMTSQGKPAVNTKLERNNPAYDALIQKRSYSGAATVFGRKYDANYAPLTDADGRLTGALFVAVAK